MSLSRAALALGLLLSALTAGCDDHDYGRIELEVTTAAPARSEVASDRVIIPVGSAIGFDAVSYTHLDVYKRQQWMMVASGRLFVKCTITRSPTRAWSIGPGSLSL